MTKFLTAVLLSFLVVGCVSHEKKMLKKYGAQPDWAKTTPVSNSYYYGVGIVQKNLSNYQQAAKKSALDQLASEISVEISSTSVLSTMDTKNEFKQEFSQNIQLHATEQLEGFEAVDSWENETHYFTCYRLSKEVHQQLKKQKIENALENAKQLYSKANNYRKENNYQQAIANCVKAIELLSPYLGYNLSTSFHGNQINLPVEIMSFLKGIEQELVVSASFYEKVITVGSSLTGKQVFALVKNKAGTPLSNLPVLFEYKALATLKHSSLSNEQGKAIYNIGKIKSFEEHQRVTVQLNLNQIIQDNTNNRLVAKILQFQSPSKQQMELLVKKPLIVISGSSLQGEQLLKNNSELINAFQSAAIRNNFTISNSANGNSLAFKYNFKTTVSKGTGRLITATTTGSISVFEDNKMIFTYAVSAVKGTHIAETDAINEAHAKVKELVDNKVIPQFANQYFNY